MPNMLGFASEMGEWLKGETIKFPLCKEQDRGGAIAITNPYAYHASAIGLALMSAFDSAYDLADSAAPVEPIEAEVQRIRSYAELVLYAARYCEVTIKQMLFCTQIPRSLYKRASLGQLLAVECYRCRLDEKERHDISLLGALAHQYFLCPVLDACVFTHLALVNRRRNIEAAHSESQTLHPRTSTESRAWLRKAFEEVRGELGHMLQHIGEIEQKMLAEMQLYIGKYPQLPSVDEFMRIPCRPPRNMLRQPRRGGQE